jgi:hypothetical protein
MWCLRVLKICKSFAQFSFLPKVPSSTSLFACQFHKAPLAERAHEAQRFVPRQLRDRPNLSVAQRTLIEDR